MNFSASLADQHAAAVELLLQAPGRIFEQALGFLLIDWIEQLGEKAGDTILLWRVLVRRAVRALGVTLGHFLPDQLVVDGLGGVVIHRRLGFGAGVHGRSPAAVGEVDDKSFALGFDDCLVHLVA